MGRRFRELRVNSLTFPRSTCINNETNKTLAQVGGPASQDMFDLKQFSRVFERPPHHLDGPAMNQYQKESPACNSPVELRLAIQHTTTSTSRRIRGGTRVWSMIDCVWLMVSSGLS